MCSQNRFWLACYHPPHKLVRANGPLAATAPDSMLAARLRRGAGRLGRPWLCRECASSSLDDAADQTVAMLRQHPGLLKEVRRPTRPQPVRVHDMCKHVLSLRRPPSACLWSATQHARARGRGCGRGVRGTQGGRCRPSPRQTLERLREPVGCTLCSPGSPRQTSPTRHLGRCCGEAIQLCSIGPLTR